MQREQHPSRLVQKGEVQGLDTRYQLQEQDSLDDLGDVAAERETGSGGCEEGEVTVIVSYVVASPVDSHAAGMCTKGFTGWGEKCGEIEIE